MASYKASYPVVAPITAEPAGALPTYGNGMFVGEMISTTITSTPVTGNLHSDDHLSESVSAFSKAEISLNTKTIPASAAVAMFGITQGTDKELIYSANDLPNYVGYGFIIGNIENGKETFDRIWTPKVKFAIPGYDCATKGENIEFKTPTISGTGVAASNGQWMLVKTFDTLEAALTDLKTKAGITD